MDEVKEGYKFSFYEYINDLDTRDFLQKIIDESPHSLKDKLKKTLQSYDGNFMNATKEIAVSIFKDQKRETHWWWFRIPKKLEGELLEDMYERNIIDQKK